MHDSSPPPLDCNDFDGILFVSRVMRKAGAGTLFFQSLVDSLLYAEKYNLYPFLWINSADNLPCYDPKVHGEGQNITFEHLTGDISGIRGEGDMACSTREGLRPGPPLYGKTLRTESYTLVGNGLWQSYFDPVSEYPFSSCKSKPVFEMTQRQVLPDMHRCSEFAVRGWAFRGIPKALLPGDMPIRDWLYDHRLRAAGIVNRHFRPQPWLLEKVEQANPVTDGNCLAVHIRLTDKGSGREKQGLEVYQPYIEAYSKAAPNDASRIYIATDDATVLETIKTEWWQHLSDRVISQPGVFRSDVMNVPTFFLMQNDKHRSNTEALVEMYAMSKCSYFVHGSSGMAEAVVYINPKIHAHSVNIDDPDRISPLAFGAMVHNLEGQHEPSNDNQSPD